MYVEYPYCCCVYGRVLGCLKAGEITVILFPGHGNVDTRPIPVNFIPPELRMPNNELDVWFEHPGWHLIHINRRKLAWMSF